MKIQESILLPVEKSSAIWNLLSATENYPDWHPIIKQCQGQLHFESNIKLQIHIPGSSPKTTSAQITGFKKMKYFSFIFKSALGKWWFQSEFVFRIFQKPSTSNCEFFCEIFCYGLVVRFFRSSIKFKYQQAADSIIRAVKRQLSG